MAFILLSLNTFAQALQNSQSIHFDGENDFIELSNMPFYSESFTVEAWIKDGNWHHIAMVRGDNDKLYMYIDGLMDEVRF